MLTVRFSSHRHAQEPPLSLWNVFSKSSMIDRIEPLKKKHVATLHWLQSQIQTPKCKDIKHFHHLNHFHHPGQIRFIPNPDLRKKQHLLLFTTLQGEVTQKQIAQESSYSYPIIMAGKPTHPLTVPPPINTGLIRPYKGNQWLISPDHKAGYFSGGGYVRGG